MQLQNVFSNILQSLSNTPEYITLLNEDIFHIPWYAYSLHENFELASFLQINKISSDTNWKDLKEQHTYQALLVFPEATLMESKNQISLLHFCHLLKPL